MDGMRELVVHECWALLRDAPVGRLAVVTEGGPDIFPVNHVVDHGSLLVRTGAGTKVAAAAGAVVAYEVDGYDSAAGEAWSVVVKGTARLVTNLHEVIDALDAPAFPWQDGPKPHFLRLEPDMLTGRRFAVRSGYQGRN